MAKKPTPPWKKPAPKGRSTRLNEASKSKARARATAAGRTYPNLVDNMRAAREQSLGASSASRSRGSLRAKG